MNVMVNEKGEANYNVYVDDKKKAASNTDTSGTGLRLEKIIVENSHLVYNDKSVQLLINAKGFNYSGNGDLSKAIFDLYSHAKIDSLDFYMNNESYLMNKKFDADLITKINTNSLAFSLLRRSGCTSYRPRSIYNVPSLPMNSHIAPFRAFTNVPSKYACTSCFGYFITVCTVSGVSHKSFA